MKNAFLILIVFGVLLCISLPSFGGRLSSDKWDVYTVEARVAYALADSGTEVQPEPDTPKPTECTCNGTGKVKSGDGLIELPCQCGKDCACKKKDEPKPEPTNKLKSERSIQMYYIGANACTYCRYTKTNVFPSLKEHKRKFFDGTKGIYTIGPEPTNMICVVDLDAQVHELAELVQGKVDDQGWFYFPYNGQMVETKLPCYLVLKDGQIIRYHIGYLNPDQVHAFYNDYK